MKRRKRYKRPSDLTAVGLTVISLVALAHYSQPLTVALGNCMSLRVETPKRFMQK